MSLMSYVRDADAKMQKRSIKTAKIFAFISVALTFLYFCMELYIPASVSDLNFYESYGWRYSFLFDLLSFVPYVVLCITVFIEEKIDRLNKRILPITSLFSFFVVEIVRLAVFHNIEFDFILDYFEYRFESGYYFLVMVVLLSKILMLLSAIFWDRHLFRIGAVVMGVVYIFTIPLAIVLNNGYSRDMYDVLTFIVGCLGAAAFGFAMWFISYICEKQAPLFHKESIVDKIRKALENDDYKDRDDDEINDAEEDEDILCDEDIIIEEILEGRATFYLGSTIQDYQKVLAHAFTEENRDIINVSQVFGNLANKKFADENGEIYSADYLYECVCKLCEYTEKNIGTGLDDRGHIRTCLYIMLKDIIELREKNSLSFKTEVCALATVLMDEDDDFWFTIGAEMSNTTKNP